MAYQIRWHIEIKNNVAEQSEEVCDLVNLDFDMNKSFPVNDRDEVTNLPQQHEIDRSIVSVITENIDVKAELDSLLMSLQLAMPHPPNSELTFGSNLINPENVTNLDKFGGYVEIQTMLVKLENTHTQIVEASVTMRSRIVEIDREFSKLSASVQAEKEQFYELTVEAIEKAERIGLQLNNLIKQISEDRESILILKAEIESVRQTIRHETEHKFNNLDLRYHQMISTWDDFQVRQKDRAIIAKKFSSWLWILSVVVGGILIMLIRILIVLK